jgi:hypothetical protein
VITPVVADVEKSDVDIPGEKRLSGIDEGVIEAVICDPRVALSMMRGSITSQMARRSPAAAACRPRRVDLTADSYRFLVVFRIAFLCLNCQIPPLFFSRFRPRAKQTPSTCSPA